MVWRRKRNGRKEEKRESNMLKREHSFLRKWKEPQFKFQHESIKVHKLRGWDTSDIPCWDHVHEPMEHMCDFPLFYVVLYRLLPLFPTWGFLPQLRVFFGFQEEGTKLVFFDLLFLSFVPIGASLINFYFQVILRCVS